MMKRSALYQTSRLSLISCSVSSLKQQSTDRHVAPLEYEPTNIYSFTLMLRAQRGSNNYQCYRLWLYRNSCTTLRKNKLHNERKEMHLFDSNFCDLLYYIILTQVYQKIFLQVSIMVNTIQTNESGAPKSPSGIASVTVADFGYHIQDLWLSCPQRLLNYLAYHLRAYLMSGNVIITTYSR